MKRAVTSERHKMKKTNTTYNRVTERIIELLEQGVCPWRRPWSQMNIRPQNFQTKREYTGINFLFLNSLGFELPYFMTYRQVKELGGNVIKGSKGFPIIYWNTATKEEEDTRTGEKQARKISFIKQYAVFNAEQIEGIEIPKPEPLNKDGFQPIERAASIVSKWTDCPEIHHGNKHASYVPARDIITMPRPGSFESSEMYYSALFHEMGHATSHAKRLNRETGRAFGSKQYALEELVAEMTSAFLCAEVGIVNTVVDNQAAYLHGWIKALKGDAKLVVKAASQAQKAANMILEHQPEDINKQVA